MVDKSPEEQLDNGELDPQLLVRASINRVIFGTDTRAGRLFDFGLILAIIISVLVVLIESTPHISDFWRTVLVAVEWSITVLFTIEYGLRLYSVSRPWRYVFSFYGLVDLFAIVPSYVGLFYGDLSGLLVLRVLRMLRVFRIFKLSHYLKDADLLVVAFKQSSRKILIFLYSVIVIVFSFGGIMFLVEGPENGFTSIPTAIYWAIVTLTTVGYGDIVPHTPIGQLLASAVMVTGYAIIAVPTGIYAAEIGQAMRKARDTRGCPGCGKAGHDEDAKFCRHCGENLNPVIALAVEEGESHEEDVAKDKPPAKDKPAPKKRRATKRKVTATKQAASTGKSTSKTARKPKGTASGKEKE